MTPVEQVGCIPRALAASLGLLERGFTPLASSGPLRRIEQAIDFVDRPRAERDPSRKQIIPYGVVLRGRQVFAAERLEGGGEARLHGKVSIGIGGHLNPVDGTGHPSGPTTPRRTADVASPDVGPGLAQSPRDGDPDRVIEALHRELNEELVAHGIETIDLLGTINDDTQPVGQVHLGIVFAVRLGQSGRAEVREVDALRGRFVAWDEAAAMRQRMETWSAFVLDAFRQGAIQ